MGRSVRSIRQGVNDTTGRWIRSARTLSPVKQACGEKVAAYAKSHSSEAFYVCDEPLEAALFSACIEILRDKDTRDRGEGAPDVDH